MSLFCKSEQSKTLCCSISRFSNAPKIIILLTHCHSPTLSFATFHTHLLTGIISTLALSILVLPWSPKWWTWPISHFSRYGIELSWFTFGKLSKYLLGKWSLSTVTELNGYRYANVKCTLINKPKLLLSEYRTVLLNSTMFLILIPLSSTLHANMIIWCATNTPFFQVDRPNRGRCITWSWRSWPSWALMSSMMTSLTA